MDKKKKLVFHLDTPYTAVSWPQILDKDQDAILELLCSVLAPLGNYRAQHVQPSKGVRERKRKRKQEAGEQPPQPVPPAPELQSHLDVGLSSVSRGLQAAAAVEVNESPSHDDRTAGDRAGRRHYSLVFVSRTAQPNALSSHLPQMVAVSSRAHPSRPPTRLVGFSKACEDRLSEALGIPRVSCIGLYDDAPGVKALVEFTRDRVSVIEVPWLKEASLAEYRETRIGSIETVVGEKTRKKTKS